MLIFSTAPSQTAFSLCDTSWSADGLKTTQERQKTQKVTTKTNNSILIKSEATKFHSQVNRVGQKHFTEAELACSDMQ